ncbi:MAG: energy-coupling factor ABC transporter ATP-binding protein, partial [Halobacteriaceae archaeon]
ICPAVASDIGLNSSKLPLTPDEFKEVLNGPKPAQLSLDSEPPADFPFGDPVIDIQNVTHSYSSETALENINLQIHAGEIHAIIGGNGAGKTTLTKAIAGLIEPDEGTITVDGVQTSETSISELGEHVGLVFQNPDAQLSKQTVQEEITFPLRKRQYKRSKWLGRRQEQRFGDEFIQDRLAETIDITDLHDEGILDADPTRLSTKNRRLTAIGAALITDPAALVLDEPVSELDHSGSDHIRSVIESLRNRDKSVVLVEHDIDFVCEVADRVTVLDDGQIVDTGQPYDIFDRENWEQLRKQHLLPPRKARLAHRLDGNEQTTDDATQSLPKLTEVNS